MPKPISVEVKERVVSAHRTGKGTCAKLSELFQLGEASVSRWVRLERETGAVWPKQPPGKVSKLDEQGRVGVDLIFRTPSGATKT